MRSVVTKSAEALVISRRIRKTIKKKNEYRVEKRDAFHPIAHEKKKAHKR